MKKILMLLLVLSMEADLISVLYAQDKAPSLMLSLYADNDLFNALGKITDDAYTTGVRFDIFYNKNHPSKFFLDRWMPKAGSKSINTFGTGIMQVMYTPKLLNDPFYQPDDYPWSASLFATHTLYSCNAEKKYDLQTELIAGVIGPAALAKPTQTILHQIIKDPILPLGWGNQFSNDVLVNINFTAEKQLAHLHDYLELLGTAQISAGTMMDGIDLGPTLLAGKMSMWFNGFMGHYNTERTGKKNKTQVYFKLKPGVKLVAWNSMLEGGMFNRAYSVETFPTISKKGELINGGYIAGPNPEIENVVTYFSYGMFVASGRFSMSYSQTHTSELVANTYSHNYGNITVTYSY